MDVAAETPGPKVRERFNRPPYQAARLLREQGRQMEGKDNMTRRVQGGQHRGLHEPSCGSSRDSR